MKVHFFNVGQGDSILLEWQKDGEDHLGIVDCNIFEGQNPLLRYLQKKDIKSIDFIILTHFHYDHFSGFPDIFKYCLDNNIKINWFLYTCLLETLEYYTVVKPKPSQKVQKRALDFFKYFNSIADEFIEELEAISYTFKGINLDNQTSLGFLSPSGSDYRKFAKAVGLYRSKTVKTVPDLNKLSTIIKITKDDKCILLTSDAVLKSFSKNRYRVINEVHLIQVPHHGSIKNIDSIFWSNLTKKLKCPAVFSVGDEPKDKLPDQATVAFVDGLGYDINSTNCVYGICYHFNQPFNPKSHPIAAGLNPFSSGRPSTTRIQPINPKFSGDKSFSVL